MKAVIPILALALALRLLFIGSESLWVDEALSVQAADRPSSDVVGYVAQHDFNPPLYFLLLHFWGALFGYSEVSSRLLSALFGVAFVLAVFLLAGSLFGRKAAVAAGIIAAVSPFYVSVSQEARMYSLFAFLSVLSFWLLVLLIGRFGFWLLAAYSAVAALMLYSHMYGLFILAAQTAWLAIKGKWLYSLVPAALFTPWLFVAVPRLYAYTSTHWLDFPSLAKVSAGFAWLAGSPLILILLFSAAAFASLRRPSGMLLLWLAVPIALSLAVSAILAPVFFYRYFAAAFPALIIAASDGVARLGRFGLAVILSFLLLSGFSLAYHYSSIENQQWRELAAFVDRNSGNESIYFSPGYAQAAFDYYSRSSLSRMQLNASIYNGSSGFWVVVVDSPDADRSVAARIVGYNSTHYSFSGLDLYRVG